MILKLRTGIKEHTSWKLIDKIKQVVSLKSLVKMIII